MPLLIIKLITVSILSILLRGRLSVSGGFRTIRTSQHLARSSTSTASFGRHAVAFNRRAAGTRAACNSTLARGAILRGEGPLHLLITFSVGCICHGDDNVRLVQKEPAAASGSSARLSDSSDRTRNFGHSAHTDRHSERQALEIVSDGQRPLSRSSVGRSPRMRAEAGRE